MKTEHITRGQAIVKVKQIRGRSPKHEKQLDTLLECENIGLN